MRQLKRYMIDIESHNLRRLYGIEFASFAAGNFNYPKEILDAKIVIYGAGIYGQALYHYLLAENKEKIIVSWVDRDFKNKSDECLYQIQPVETIQNLGFDFLIIAVKNENVAMEIRKNLINQYNVDANKIIWKEEPYKYLLTNMIF